MLRSDDHLLKVSDLFGAAALDGDWTAALNGFADACGGAHGQLTGVSGEAEVRFRWSPRLAAEALDEPAANPRVRMGLTLPVLEAWHEVDGLGADLSYAEFCRRHDIPYGSQTPLTRDPSGVIGLSVLRTRAQGAPAAEDRRTFERLAPHARAAVKMQQTLEGRGADLLAGVLDRLGRPAFVCDGQGLVQAMTPSAEALLGAGALRLGRGQLRAADAGATHRLEAAIDRARHGVAPSSAVILPHPDPDQVRMLEVVALPRAPYAFGFEPRVLVLAQAPDRAPDAVARLLQAAYGLTAAEAQVAALMGTGESPEAIALARQVSEGTVRTHLRAIYQKLDVSRQLELSARLARFR